jgi:ribosomal silencing factor RsfS
MAAGKSVINLAQVAAEAIAEKLGVDIIAIDMTEQMGAHLYSI